MSTIIFDFDGTIADTFDYVSELMSRKAGLPNLTLDERRLRFGGLSIRGMMHNLKKPYWWGLWMFFYGRREMSRHMYEIKLFVGMELVIRELHKRGHKLYVLSSNRNQNIRLLLDHYKLAPYFTHTQGNASILRKGVALRWLLWRHHIDPKDCYYVGDETGDLDAARRLGIRGVGVVWGYNHEEKLLADKPVALAKKPRDLLKLLQ